MLTDDARVQSAARFGELWGTDPVAILDCSDEEWMIRLACAQVIMRDREEERKKRGQA